MHAAVEGLVLHATNSLNISPREKRFKKSTTFFLHANNQSIPRMKSRPKPQQTKKRFQHSSHQRLARQNLSLVDFYLYKCKEPTVETQNQAASHQNPEKPPTAPTKFVLEYESPITTVVAAPRRTSRTGDCDKRSGEHHQTRASTEL